MLLFLENNVLTYEQKKCSRVQRNGDVRTVPVHVSKDDCRSFAVRSSRIKPINGEGAIQRSLLVHVRPATLLRSQTKTYLTNFTLLSGP